MILEITDVQGNTEALTDFQFLSRERGVNGEKVLSFTSFYTPNSLHAFPLVQGKSIVELDGEPYVITTLDKKPVGNSTYKEVVALHKFFHDMKGKRLKESYSSSLTADALFSHIFNNTGYTFTIFGTMYAMTWENFGKKNKLALFVEAIQRYGVEFEIAGTNINIKPKIGRSEIDFQLRYNHNITAISYAEDWTDFATYIEGTGKRDDKDVPIITGSYTSPNAAVYGIEETDSIDDERYTTQAGLDAALQEALIDEPVISIEVDFEDMRKQGYPYEQPQEGDEFYLIHEPLQLDLKVRVVKIKEELDHNLEPTRLKVTLANLRKSLTDITVDAGRQIRDVIGDDGKIKYDVLDAQTKRLTEALKSAQTELIFENGIIGVDPDNPNKLTLFNSHGFGVSNDGGETFRDAITGDGFVLSAGAIGFLEANHIRLGPATQWEQPNIVMTAGGFRANTGVAGKYVDVDGNGVTVNKGAFKLYGADGRLVIEDGIARNSLVVQSTDPPFIGDAIVEQPRYYQSLQSDYDFIGAYQFNHEGRYLIIQGFVVVNNAGVGIAVESYQGLGFYQTALIARDSAATGAKPFQIIIDLGVPTYAPSSFYIKMRSNNAPNEGRCRVNWVSQYG